MITKASYIHIFSLVFILFLFLFLLLHLLISKSNVAIHVILYILFKRQLPMLDVIEYRIFFFIKCSIFSISFLLLLHFNCIFLFSKYKMQICILIGMCKIFYRKIVLINVFCYSYFIYPLNK